jgi:hypothetical protein
VLSTLSWQLKVDSVTIRSASSSYNVADCEIYEDVTTGSWEDTNSAG